MTAQQLKNFIRTTLVALRNIGQEYTTFDAVIDFIVQGATSAIQSWSSSLTFNTDGSGSGAFCTSTDTDNNLRFWKTKTDGNINHQPPTNPLVTEDSYWKEVSPSDGSAIKEWAAGVYPAGLVIVYYDLSGAGSDPSLFVLLDPTRPFTSTNLSTELAAGKWKRIGINLSYTPEDVANKETGSAPTDNTTKYPSSHTVYTALATKQNNLGFTPENVANKATSLASNDNTHYPTTAAAKAADDANLALAYSYTDSAIAGSFNYRGTYDGSSGNYPSSGGRYTAGAPAKGDAWEILNACTIQGTPYDQGDILVAKVNGAGNTSSDWGTSEHNTQQATISLRGTAMVVDTTTIQTPGTTDDQKMVTAVKFWQGIATLKGQTNTWTLAQTFSAAPVFSSVTASQYLKVDSGKALTSVASIPDSDISYANKNANLVFAGPASGGAAAPSFRSLVPSDIPALAYWGLNGTSTLTGAVTITSNAANQLTYNGAWTASANNQYHEIFNPTITLRSTASDALSTLYWNPTINISSTLQDASVLNINANYVLKAGVASGSSSTIFVTSSGVSGMTSTTYNNVAPASTTGIGTGALFTIVISASNVAPTSINCTTNGSNYQIGDTITFNGSQFGSGSGSFTFRVGNVNGLSLGANAAAIVVQHSLPLINNGIINKQISFRDSTNSEIGSLATLFYTGNSQKAFAIYDRNGQALLFDGSSLISSRNLQLSGNVSFTTVNGTSFTATVNNTPTFTNSIYLSNPNVRVQAANLNAAAYRDTSVIIVGVINTLNTLVGGSSYTNGTYSNVSLTGGTGSAATANITVSGGAVTACTIVSNSGGGQNYSVGDVLSASPSSIGGTGSGFSITVASVDFANVVVSSFSYSRAISDAKSQNNYVGFYGDVSVNITSTQAGTLTGFLWNPQVASIGSFSRYGVRIVSSSDLNGFGTATPNANMHIVGAGSNPTLKTVGAGTGTNYSYVAYQSDGTTLINFLKDNGDFQVGLSSSKLGFFGTSALAQATNAGAAATFTANSGTGVNDASTFDGYTLKQIVKALRNYGLLQ